MALVERIRILADEKDTTLVGLERSLDFSRGSIRKWDNSSPSVDKLDKVAKYFNVSIDYLLGKTEKRGSYINDTSQLTEKEEKDLAKTMKKIKERLINEQGLMFDGDILDEETAQLLLESIEQQERTIKILNRKYTPKKYRK